MDAAGAQATGCCTTLALVCITAPQRSATNDDATTEATAHPPPSAKRDLAAVDDEIYGPRRYIVVVGTAVKYAGGSRSFDDSAAVVADDARCAPCAKRLARFVAEYALPIPLVTAMDRFRQSLQ